MSDLKAQARASAAETRRRLDPDRRAAASREIQARLLALRVFSGCPAVLLYSASDDEVDTSLIREAAVAAGKRLYYPRVPSAAEGMAFIRVLPAERLVPGRWGIGEPQGDERFVPGGAGLIVVPALALDRCGGRLGRGGGYYDRALRHLRPPVVAVGVAFSVQVIEAVPMGADDEPVDVVLTEHQTIICDAARVGHEAARHTAAGSKGA
jgi:5-formyltetrahydrofolate cyclo-ligase